MKREGMNCENSSHNLRYGIEQKTIYHGEKTKSEHTGATA
jgi:hypothetical protein